MTGQAEFSEVYLTDVRVPDADRIGDVGDGLARGDDDAVERAHLDRRRGTGAGARQRGDRRGAAHLGSSCRRTGATPALRDRLVRLWCDAEVLRLTNLVPAAAAAAARPGPEGSIAKLAFGTLNQRIYELCVDLLGADALVGADYGFRRDDHLGYVGPPGLGPHVLPAQPGQLDRGWHDGDPAQHRRRAGARTPARTPHRQGRPLERGPPRARRSLLRRCHRDETLDRLHGMSDPRTIVVGGGLAGLTAAAHLVRQGHEVLVLESGEHLGGRARSRHRDGYDLNLGPHALYRTGGGLAALRSLGVPVKGRLPRVDRAGVLVGGAIEPALAHLRHGVRDRRHVARALTGLGERSAAAWDGRPAGEWVESVTDDEAGRALLASLVRTSTYAGDLDLLDAGAATRQLRRAAHGVLYLHRGWSSLVSGLADVVRAGGGTICTGRWSWPSTTTMPSTACTSPRDATSPPTP